MSRYEQKMKDKLDDEIKLARLESLVPEELEKRLTLNSNRLRTFEDARLEVVTYVEAKFGFRIRDSKPSATGARGHSDPMDFDAVNSLSLVCQRKRIIQSARWAFFFFKCGRAQFQRDCNARKGTSKQSCGKGKQSKSWSKTEPSFPGKGKSKENKGKSKGKAKETQSANRLSGLENSKSEASSDIQESAQKCTTDFSWNEGLRGDE